MKPMAHIVAFLAAAAVASAAAAESDAEALARGKKIYRSKCSRCHRFYNPASYDDEKWEMWMTKMKQKAHLDEGDFALLLTYLQTLRPPDAQTSPSK
jgi:mono/diheme cytochrome c family protein